MRCIFTCPGPFEVVGGVIIAELVALHVSSFRMRPVMSKEHCSIFLRQSALMRVKHCLWALKSNRRWRRRLRPARKLVYLTVSWFIDRGARYRVLQLVWIIGQIGPRRHHAREKIIVLHFISEPQIHLRSALLYGALRGVISLPHHSVRWIQELHISLPANYSLLLIGRVSRGRGPTLAHKLCMQRL